jgi:alkylation response protein AidB-like acyl-CoA dehydrogenase
MKVPTRAELVALSHQLAARFATRAAEHDAEGSFPYENFAMLREAGYHKLTVPVALGGWGAGLLDAVMTQEALATGDGSTALAITMHVQTIGAAASGEKWEPSVFERLCGEVIERGALVNSCATEPELGSPSRGGRPATLARREGQGWRITGRKSFASMSPVLDYFIVPALIEADDEIARFLVPRQEALAIEDTWDSMGMRSTGSHDLVLMDAFTGDEMLISRSPGGARPDPTKIALNPWFTLTVAACYLGVAVAALRTALEYAHDRVPTALGKPIATLESIQRRAGEGELALQVARQLLYRTAEAYDSQPAQRGTQDFQEQVLITKLVVSNQAIKVVDDAMRVVGGASMMRSLPLERYYRDVRAGLYHPPSDDSALALLGRVALGRAALGRAAPDAADA